MQYDDENYNMNNDKKNNMTSNNDEKEIKLSIEEANAFQLKNSIDPDIISPKVADAFRS